ncbi:MAG: DUF4384 domain-containing protein [Pyrinomonadaceae bacterium]
MHYRTILSLSLALILCGLGVGLAQNQDDDDVRGAFLSSRDKTTSSASNTASNTKARHKIRRAGGTSGPAKNTNNNVAANSNTSRKNSNAGSTSTATPIGLGYTLFKRDASGDAVRMDPASEFHNGDRVRISLEPNVDGYLYVFHREGDGEPEMIFPDWRLEDGNNAIDAHVPYDVPSGFEKDERLRWFTFYGKPATERLYIVITREPLASVPTSEALVAFCAANKTKCPWQPVPQAWAKVEEARKADVQVVASTNYGQAQTEKEKVATTRGLGLDQSAPPPSVIRMSASTKAPVLVTVLDLVHK